MCTKSHMKFSGVAFVACTLVQTSLILASVTQVVTDSSWRAIGSAPPSGWNTELSFDDSNAAGWESAFKSPSENNIWITSNMSSQAPNQAWFRHVFTLDGAVTDASADFFFDDNGEGYINGHLVITDSARGAIHTIVPIDPSFFVIGDNLIAMHGIDTHAPFNNIALSMTITTPEPASTFVFSFTALLLRRRHSRHNRYSRSA
ncbi:MAG TPA: hypothetical protein VHD56_01960 [Tepidisphaeraceae bacterium]|nr:hypothetical protein [Tepidisphaeraceae bacterium]